MLSRLIYTSTRTEQCPDSEIDKILESAMKNNSPLDVTGILIYSEKRFLQCLEGEYDTVINLYNNIKKDVRHKDVVMIHLIPTSRRIFPSWQMGKRKIDENRIEFDTEISESDKEEFLAIFTGEKNNSNEINSIVERAFAA